MTVSSAFRHYEAEVLRLLCEDSFSDRALEAICEHPGPAEYEFTGGGYFVTVTAPWLPTNRSVHDTPNVVGLSGEIRCGFVVFIEKNELTLECHNWGGEEIPADIRDRALSISVEPINVVDLR